MSANVYWMEFTNELVENGQVDYFGQPITGNAKRTRHLGFEFDGAVKLYNDISVSGNFTISQNKMIKHSEYIEMKDTAGNKIFIPQILDNNLMGGFPSLLGNVRLAYKKAPLSFSIVMKYVGSFYTDNFKNTKNQNDAYVVVNTELLCNLPRVYDLNMMIRAGIYNLFNNLYFANGEGEAFFPAAERNYIVGLTITL
jgi:iron complex outermembrane receptor protein